MVQSNKWVITRYQKQDISFILSACIENGTVNEISLQPEHAGALLGNIYIGKVRNIASNIEAAFVEIEGGIICYYSLQENEAPIFINRPHNKIKKPLVEGDEILVQVSREAMKTKAPAVTGNLSFAGKYLVVTSGKKQLGLSSKLSKEERERLKSILTPYWDGTYGVIVRTNAAGMDEEILKEELEQLSGRMQHVCQKSVYQTCFSRVYQQESDYISALRNLPKGSFDEILIEDEDLYASVYQYLSESQPEDLSLLRRYEDRMLSLIKVYSLEKAIEDALRERVWLKSGAYLIIQPTEALTVIDVNTGKFETGKKKRDTFRKINLEAAKEVARQLRLRNLSGIIVVDFIDMEDARDKEQLLETLRYELKKDPVKTLLVDMTALGLVEITRKKVRKTLKEQISS